MYKHDKNFGYNPAFLRVGSAQVALLPLEPTQTPIRDHNGAHFAITCADEADFLEIKGRLPDDLKRAGGPNVSVDFFDYGRYDDVVMAFRDNNPRAAIHVLVVPKQHIKNSSELDESHISLGTTATTALSPSSSVHYRHATICAVQYMVAVGKRVLAEQCAILFADALAPAHDHKFGFHQYPFNSVSHLHLHCIVPPFTNCWSRFRYSESCVGHYISADALVEILRLN
ncbi:hypothetical protein DYB32_007137 [Aphanomyces invadans]|uniref:HIT domain-containing protein n=1 Tax=Aphanomyces invadans TaxID=157072 RepID=A0A418APL0_9STRA|nr:hypothetical protein DYB32_007137 [Aphanomyces invadans]